MKKILLIIVLGWMVTDAVAQQPAKVCDNKAEEKALKKFKKKYPKDAKVFGEAFDISNAVKAMDVEAEMKSGNITQKENVTIKGKVSEVCQNRGCWMTVDKGNGEVVRIKFKDYAFFMPKDISGKTVYVKGTASFQTISVAQQQHYMEDAGKSKEEIEKITEPKINFSFLASGVVIE